MKNKTKPPIVSIVGFSGTGKTTLLERLIPELKDRGFEVGTIKHHSNNFEMDQPGKDSWRHKKAGASATIISSPSQIGMVMDVDHDHKVNELAPFLSGVDIILTEGYKYEDNPKLEVYRPEIYLGLLSKDDKNLLAVISDMPLESSIPWFSTEDAEGLADFLVACFGLIPAIPDNRKKA